MSEAREPAFDRVVALVLRIGAFAAFAVMVTGVLVRIFVPHGVPGRIETVGVVVMMATPVVRVFVAMILFLRERDWRYGAVSFGVLTILLLGAAFGIGEH